MKTLSKDNQALVKGVRTSSDKMNFLQCRATIVKFCESGLAWKELSGELTEILGQIMKSETLEDAQGLAIKGLSLYLKGIDYE